MTYQKSYFQVSTSIIVLSLLLFVRIGNGQNTIQGNIVDDVTGNPIIAANVFFANTTIGTSSDQVGFYQLAGFPSGKYDFFVQFIGYEPFQRSIQFNGNDHVVIDIRLKESTVVLDEILIKPDTSNLTKNQEMFKKLFLGNSRDAKAAEIQNINDIYIYLDESTQVLFAHASKPIIINNSSTGYRIIYKLKQFEFNSKTGEFAMQGIPKFEEMTSKSKGEYNKWLRTRNEIYNGSLMHFMRSWYHYGWIENQFKVSRAYQVPNKYRLSDAALENKISKLQAAKQQGAGPKNLKFNDVDSLVYFQKMKTWPVYVDSIAAESLSGAELSDSTHFGWTNFTGILAVETKKQEDVAYTLMLNRWPSRQQSKLRIREPIKIYSNGYYENFMDVFVENYWSW